MDFSKMTPGLVLVVFCNDDRLFEKITRILLGLSCEEVSLSVVRLDKLSETVSPTKHSGIIVFKREILEKDIPENSFIMLEDVMFFSANNGRIGAQRETIFICLDENREIVESFCTHFNVELFEYLDNGTGVVYYSNVLRRNRRVFRKASSHVLRIQ